MRNLSRVVCVLLMCCLLLGSFVACDGGAGSDDGPIVVPGGEESGGDPDQPTSYQERMYMIKDHMNKFKTQGRTAVSDEGLRCDWSAAGIEFRADCEGTVTLDLESAYALNQYYTILVDGVQVKDRTLVQEKASTLVLAEDLPRGVHTFQVYRQDQILPANLTVLKSVTVKGELREPPALKDLYIEICGDSITAGDGLLGVNGVDTGGTDVTDGTRTYGYLVAQALDADWSIVAQGGATLVKRANAIAIPEIYKYTSFVRDRVNEWEFKRPADLVIVNLGTNDFSAGAKDFVQAAKDFGALIQEKNPGTKIVFCIGMMTSNYRISQYKKVVNDMGGAEKGVYFVELPINLEGSNQHPNAKGNQDAAQVLIDFIKPIVGK